MYCKKCGTEISDDGKFCKGCGTPLKDTKDNIIEVSNLEKNSNLNLKKGKVTDENINNGIKLKNEKNINELKKKPLSKKVIGSIAGVIILVLVCGFTLFKSDSPEKVVEKFHKGITEENINDLKKILSSDDRNLELDDDNIKILIEGYKNNLSDLNTTVEELSSQAFQIKFNPNDFSSSESNEVNLIKKKSGLKEKYYINVSAKYISLGEKLDGTNYIIKHNGKTLDANIDSEQIGPFVPGSYQIEGKLKNEYVDLQDSTEVSLFSSEKIREVNLFKNVNKVTINCNEKEALLIIDGVNTKKKIKDVNTMVGLKNGTILQAVLEKDGKTRTSNKDSVYNSKEIYLEVESEKVIDYNEYNKKVTETVQGYLEDFASAVNYNDFGYIEDYLYPGSQIYKEQVKNIKSIHDSGISEEYITSYINSNKFDESKKEWTVIVNETYDITKEDKTNRKSFTNEYKLKVNEEAEKLKLTEIKVNVE